MHWLRTVILVSGLLLSAAPCLADDPLREQLIAERLTARLAPDEIVRLGDEGSQFIGLFKYQPNYTTRGAIILVHSMAGHPDWPEVIAPLRNILPRTGWATLSVQMPILSPGRPLADYGTTLQAAGHRINASVKFLRAAGFHYIAIAGYSFGAATVADYLASKANSTTDPNAFVSVSMLSQAFLRPRPSVLQKIESINVPILDIYGSQDFSEVLQQADDRRLAGSKNTKRMYQQYKLGDANHYYTGREAQLANRISTWLDSVLPEQPRPDFSAGR